MLLLAISLLTPGCLFHHSRDKQRNPPAAYNPALSQKPILTPESGLAGKVMRVNQGGRFVVVNFPIGHLPAIEQRMNVYRLGLKTGEIKITGPQYDDNIVGDVITGDVQPGDEVRDR